MKWLTWLMRANYSHLDCAFKSENSGYQHVGEEILCLTPQRPNFLFGCHWLLVASLLSFRLPPPPHIKPLSPLSPCVHTGPAKSTRPIRLVLPVLRKKCLEAKQQQDGSRGGLLFQEGTCADAPARVSSCTPCGICGLLPRQRQHVNGAGPHTPPERGEVERIHIHCLPVVEVDRPRQEVPHETGTKLPRVSA